ncbi:alpha/beta hydrolase family protein [Actinokineospora guangxiensis]|uniref:Alpha/beta hydrolase family protein n=1 Tax=Actinokineospora guangxiensis TaxID=1490288 RepID=A0ABW0EYF6_9PSEU
MGTAHRRRSRLQVAVGLLAASVATATPAAADSGPEPSACPAEIAVAATCYTGQDSHGAHYAIAIPEDWNRSLVVHAHGGPDLTDASDPARAPEDLARWSVMVEEGYAWAGSAYRRGGYGTRMGAADTETVRRLFVSTFGEPRRTYLHGQSWGGNVAAKAAEIHRGYDGVLLTNGVLAGGSRGYDYRVDLRVVYQHYCGNHPRPSEPQYPLWMGLRADSAMTPAGLRARLRECTGHDSPAERTAAQQRNLTDILAVTKIPERALESHLRFATFTFRDIVHKRLDGRNPFSNRAVRYTGSHDDAALNAGVERFSADPSARRDLSFDSDPTGLVTVPVLTLHAIGDPTAFVEHESAYRASLRGSFSGHRLVQTFTTETEHSALSDAGYATAMSALDRWAESGHRPSAAAIARECPRFNEVYGTGCFFDPAYRPADYSARVYARPGGLRWPALSPVEELVLRHRPGVGISP